MIVCLGTTPVYQRSMVFDRVTPDGVNRATAVHDYASGKSINVARVLHTLGEDVIAVGFAGGRRGEAMLADLDAAGIRHDFVRVEPETRQCVTVIDRSTRTATELVEESQAVRPEDWEQLELKLAEHVPQAAGCVLSGSLPPGADKEFYRTCMESFRNWWVPVVLDARGTPLRRAHGVPGCIPKLNHSEFVETYGASATTEEGVLEHLATFPPPLGYAVVTMGAAGAIAVDDEHRRIWRIVPPRISPRSAVGSGDAFSAGLIYKVVRDEPFETACAFGAACGAANAMTDLAGHLNPADVESLFKQVRVEPLLWPDR